MAQIIGIMGESGAGKTTSLRNLDPKTTLYVDADKKGLSWKGWKKDYNAENKNYFADDHANVVKLALQKVNTDKEYKDYKVVVIDTLNGIMVADEMRRMKEKGFDKWQDLAASVYDIIDYALGMRDGVTVIFTAHTQTDHDDNGYMFTRIKTSGRKLDKIVLESKFPVVLHAKTIDGKHVFETQADFSTAKTPLGAFEDKYIDNDIVEVLKVLEEY
jgi:molybdopterin-guanine dinucleotide biosynthesis protein